MDTIEILEAIGTNASLRHASAERLACVLSEMDASKGLKQTAITGDLVHLADEFGRQIVSMVQSQIQGGNEDEEEEEHDPGREEGDENDPSLPES